MLCQFAETWRFFDSGLTDSKKERRGDPKRETLVTLWGLLCGCEHLDGMVTDGKTTVVPNQSWNSYCRIMVRPTVRS